MLNEKKYLLELQKFDSIATQWKNLLNHPQLAEMEMVKEAIEKLTVIANAEAGCEQSNRKYNLMKNDLSHRMQIPMIKARMRVGSNGPPLHLFDASKVLEHWKRNGHRLALKVDQYSADDSHVIKRIREESAKKKNTFATYLTCETKFYKTLLTSNKKICV